MLRDCLFSRRRIDTNRLRCLFFLHKNLAQHIDHRHRDWFCFAFASIKRKSLLIDRGYFVRMHAPMYLSLHHCNKIIYLQMTLV